MEVALGAFINHLERRDRSSNTVNAYRRDLEAFFSWLAEKTGAQPSLAEVTNFDVRKYRDYLISLGRKPATVNRRLAALRTFFDWAVNQDKIVYNPAAPVQGVKQRQGKPKALNEQEVYKLQRAAAARWQLAEVRAGKGNVTPTIIYARRDDALLNLFLNTGIRVGAAASLQMSDVVLNERSGKVIVRSGKGRKYREIPLNKEARQALQAYLAVRPKDAGEAFFVGQRGALGARGIQMRIEALGEATGVGVTSHRLRHTFATRLLRETDTDLVTVSVLMGHSKVATTAIYTQPGEEELIKAVEGLGA